MAVEVEWSKSAKKDFKKILAYISKDSFINAQRVARKIREKIELIQSFPGIGHQASRYKSVRARQIVVMT